jgi:hypothetical protein
MSGLPKSIAAFAVLAAIFGLIYLLDKRDRLRSEDQEARRLNPLLLLPSKPISLIHIPSRTSIYRATRWLVGAAVATFAVATGIVSIWGPFWPTYPQIHAVGPEFSLPFAILNSNNFYDIFSMKIICALGNTVPDNPKAFASYNVSVLDDEVGILAGGKHSYTCDVAPPGYRVNSAEMRIIVKYLTAWRGIQVGDQRQFSEIFHWQYGQWVEGPLN